MACRVSFLILWIIGVHSVSCAEFEEPFGYSDMSYEGFPVWLEKEGVWGPNRIVPLDETRSSFLAQIEKNNHERQINEADRLLRALSGERVVYSRPEDRVRNSDLRHFKIDRRAVPGTISIHNPMIDWHPIVIGTVCAAFLLAALIGTAVYQFRRHQSKRRQKELEDQFTRAYSSQQKPSPSSSTMIEATAEGDRKLAQSAQMYHYQHQKQQMLAIGKANDTAQSSDEASTSDPEESNFNVFEGPGLAKSDKLEVDNPLYTGDTTISAEAALSSDGDEGSDATPTAKNVEP